MTYCVALKLDQRLVFMSDSRTNAGVDNISTYNKMFHWEVPGERSLTLLTAGNLATTQAVVSLLDERSKAPKDRDPTLLRVPTLFQAAKLVGNTLKEVVADYEDNGPTADSPFSATLILGGQIKGMAPRLFMIYPEGNFVEAGDETPFLQIGETKYGRPIILRAFDPTMSAEDAVSLLCLSFDSTLKANLSVGMPLNVHVYEADSLKLGQRFSIEDDDPYFSAISAKWGDALKQAFAEMPRFPMERPRSGTTSIG